MCSLSNLESTKRRILIWNNINCAVYFLLIALVAYSEVADQSRCFFVCYSIFTLPFIFLYCFVEVKLNIGYIFCNSNTERSEPYYWISTHIIRGLILVHDFVFLVLISVSIIFVHLFDFFVQNFAFKLSCFCLQSYGHAAVN